MARETLTSSPPPGRRRAGRGRAGPCSSTGSIGAALGADARDEERAGRARSRGCAASSSGAVAPDHEADRPARAPARREACDPLVEPFRRRAGGRVGGDLEILQLAGAGVGCPAQDVGEAVEALEQRRDGLGAEVRVDGDGVRPELVEQRDRPGARPSTRCRPVSRPR